VLAKEKHAVFLRHLSCYSKSNLIVDREKENNIYIYVSLLSFSIGTSVRSFHTKHSCVARALTTLPLICIWLQTKMTQKILWAAYIGHNANKAG
jgi:hypothetical protein